MARKKLDVTPHCLNFRNGDIEFLKDFCRNKDINMSDIVRTQISKVVDKIKAEQARVSNPATPIDPKDL